ncbi:MAG: excisionase family DNA binding protein [Bacteroidia bacterium]
MANDDTFSFQEALKELHLEEDELRKLVSEGEIRAFRDGDDMRLRRTDIEGLRSELGEDIAFEDDDFEDAGMATEEISEADTLIDEIDDVEDIDVIEDIDEVEDEEEEIIEAAAIVEFEEEFEGMGMRVLMMATTVLLIMGLPLVVSIATGRTGGIARGIGGIFFEDLK